jgi:hypothetical protein
MLLVVNVTPDHDNADTSQLKDGHLIKFYRVPIVDEMSSPLVSSILYCIMALQSLSLTLCIYIYIYIVYIALYKL